MNSQRKKLLTVTIFPWHVSFFRVCTLTSFSLNGLYILQIGMFRSWKKVEIYSPRINKMNEWSRAEFTMKISNLKPFCGRCRRRIIKEDLTTNPKCKKINKSTYWVTNTNCMKCRGFLCDSTLNQETSDYIKWG